MPSRSCRPRMPLEPDDLERLATAAFLAGQDDLSVETWERAHQERLRRRRRAARRPLLGLADLRAAHHRRVRPRRRLAGANSSLARRRPGRMRREGPSPDTGSLPARRHGRLGDRLRHRRPRRRDRRSVRRHRSGDARPQPPGPGADRAGPDRRGDEPARRDDGRRHRRRGLRDRRRRRLLQRDRGLPGGAGPAPGTAVDDGADALVRHAAGPRPVQRELSGPPRRDHAVARRMAGCARGRATGARAATAAGSARGGRRLLSAGRAAPAAGRVRASRGGVSRGEPVGSRATARPGADATDPGATRCRVGGDPSGRRGGRGPVGAVAPAPRPRRDHARRR